MLNQIENSVNISLSCVYITYPKYLQFYQQAHKKYGKSLARCNYHRKMRLLPMTGAKSFWSNYPSGNYIVLIFWYWCYQRI